MLSAAVITALGPSIVGIITAVTALVKVLTHVHQPPAPKQ